MNPRFRFDRLELAGSLGDLGTLLPLGVGMIMINGLEPAGLLLSVGIVYVLSGAYYGITVPVQPMKVIGAYAIATGIGAPEILASGLLMGVFLLIVGATGAITLIGRYTPVAAVKGVQLSTGTLLMAEGVRLMAGTSAFQAIHQAAEPYLVVQSLGPLPIGVVIGAVGGILALFLLDSRRFPAGLVVILGGLALGLLLGTHEGMERVQPGLHLPELFPFGWPATTDFTVALFVLVLPQIPMTIGNAVVANVDLAHDYFGDDARRLTYRASCIGMALANFLSFAVGGMPLCHGAGGLAAHYRFGARTGGSNLMIGAVFIVAAIVLGADALPVVNLLPMSVLGILLLFAGSQLALNVIDVNARKDLFVCLAILGVTLAANLAVGFVLGVALAYALKSEKLNI